MQNLQHRALTKQTQDLIDKLLLGKFSITEIAKIVGVSESLIQAYTSTK